MKQEIENIIKKNLPEKNWRNKWNCHQVGCDWNRNRTFGSKVCDMNCKNVLDNISQINTSLIANEVLKVVVVGEIMRFMEKIQERANKIPPNLLLNEVVNYAYDRKKELLSSLSLNKENEN